MSDGFDDLDATEKAGIGAALNRRRALHMQRSRVSRTLRTVHEEDRGDGIENGISQNGTVRQPDRIAVMQAHIVRPCIDVLSCPGDLDRNSGRAEQLWVSKLVLREYGMLVQIIGHLLVERIVEEAAAALSTLIRWPRPATSSFALRLKSS